MQTQTTEQQPPNTVLLRLKSDKTLPGTDEMPGHRTCRFDVAVGHTFLGEKVLAQEPDDPNNAESKAIWVVHVHVTWHYRTLRLTVMAEPHEKMIELHRSELPATFRPADEDEAICGAVREALARYDTEAVFESKPNSTQLRVDAEFDHAETLHTESPYGDSFCDMRLCTLKLSRPILAASASEYVEAEDIRWRDTIVAILLAIPPSENASLTLSYGNWFTKKFKVSVESVLNLPQQDSVIVEHVIGFLKADGYDASFGTRPQGSQGLDSFPLTPRAKT